MELAAKVWRLLVGVKDGLVLAFMLLFFGMLYAAMSARPVPAAVQREGALLIRMDGALVEEPRQVDPMVALSTGQSAPAEVRERDVLRALAGAASDDKVKAVVLDLSQFSGGGLVHVAEVGTAMDRVRAAKKPVLVFGTMLGDSGVALAAHASEAWIDPLGGAFVAGPGGQHLYYARLLERLKVSAHVFRVGTYKDFVEPYIRNDMSAPSRAARQALYGAVFADWRSQVLRARPKAQIDRVVSDPVVWFRASGGDGAKAALAAGLVDHIGTRAEFGEHVAKLVGEDASGGAAAKRPGAFAHTTLEGWLAAHPESTKGRVIAVVTVAGEITDGNAGPGEAGGERIARLIDGAGELKPAALVVRVDSPGGSVGGAEAIRAAIARQKAKGLPVVVSMANLAASGGYWVSTPGTRLFAQPETITGSIGIFAVVPSFEKALAHYGVSSDGVSTTKISGQPDVFAGLSPEVEAMLQANIEAGYGRFVGLVAASRHQTPAQIDAIAQGRVWDGGSARKNGLIDTFGGLDEAMAAAAEAAHLKADEWHPVFLAEPLKGWSALLAALPRHRDDEAPATGDGAVAADWPGMVARGQQAALARVVADVEHLLGAGGAQALCLECVEMGETPAPRPQLARPGRFSVLALLGLAL